MQDDNSQVDLGREITAALNRHLFPLVLFTLIAAQAIGFGWLGVNRAGWLWSQSLQVVVNLIAIACTIHAFHRARGFARQFWFLLTCSLAIWGIANGIFLHRTYAGLTTDSTTVFNALYRGYGVPVLVILFIRESESLQDDWLTLLDSLQIGIVVLALYLGFFSLSSQGSLLHDALLANTSLLNNLENLFLIVAIAVRLRLSRSRTFRGLLVRLLWFLVVYAVVSGIGNYISTHGKGDLAAWFDLVWTVPYCAAAILATQWTMQDEEESRKIQNGKSLAHILEANLGWAILVLVAVLSIHSTGKWQLLGTATIAASILLYAARLSLTQHRQGRTIEVLNQIKRDLQQLSGHHSMILDSAGEGIVVIDAQGKQTFVNPAAAKTLGYRPEEIIGRQSHTMWHHTRADGSPFPSEECPIYAAFKDGIVHRGVDEVFWRKDGTSFCAEYVSTPIWEEGRVTGAVVVFQDVSGKRLAENALRESEERFRDLYHHVTDAVFVHAVEANGWPGRFLEVNDVACQRLGYTREELLCMTPLDIDSQESHVNLLLIMKRISAGKSVIFEQVHVSKDNRRIPVEINARLFTLQGQPAVVALARDLSERRHAEEALRQAEERLRMAAEAAGVGYWDWDLVSGQHFWSEECKRHFGWATDAPRSIRDFLQYVHPEDRQFVDTAIKRSLEANEDFNPEYRVAWPDGTVRWLAATGRVFFDPAGKPIRMSGIVVDITERKLSEEALHLQTAALESAANAIVITNSDGNIEWANSAFTSLTGYRPGEALGRNPRFLKSGMQDPEFYRNLWSTVRAGHVWHGELENRRKDGSLYTEEMTITPVLSKSGEISHFIAIKQDVTHRKQSEKALQQAEEKYREIFENAVLGIFQSTPDGRFLTVNNEFAHMMGYGSPEQMVAQVTDIARQLYADRSRYQEFQLLLNEEGVVRNFEYQAYRCDGSKIWLLENARTIAGSKGEIAYYEGTTQDITENRLLEAQFRQAQKLEAVGRLAGGVAHDFNNMLGVIIGYGEILQTQLPPRHPAIASATEIQKAARRAADLTRQLLAFSRKQLLQAHVLDLNLLIEELSKMLRRLIGEDVELVCHLGTGLQRVKADPSQIEQVIMNLAVNARDAMPNGGQLSIETTNAEVDEHFAERHPPMKPGSYVLLSVTDTGSGMNSETLARIFEPFFTTKEQGKGTGLGLSIVYGVVKQSGGYVWVDSEPSRGTAFSIYLPVTTETLTTFAPPDPPAPLKGEEMILVVEDEPSLCELIRIVLARSGYKVLVAHSGLEALSVLRTTNGSVQLLLADIVMPGEMTGPQLAEAVRALGPDIRTLFMTGFAGELQALEGLALSGMAVITKPFSSELLLRKVRERLDKGAAGQAAGSCP